VFAVSVAALVGTLMAGIVEFVRKGFSLDLTLAVTATAIIGLSARIWKNVHLSRVLKMIETLRAARPIAPSAEKEKRDLESVLWGLRRRTWLFGVSLFLTLAPLSFDFTHGLSRMVRDVPWHAAFDWSLAAVLWFLYFANLRRHTATLVCAILFTLIPIPFVLHSVLADRRVLEFAILWVCAAFIWLGYFRQRSC
jgi:hypothetical protein